MAINFFNDQIRKFDLDNLMEKFDNAVELGYDERHGVIAKFLSHSTRVEIRLGGSHPRSLYAVKLKEEGNATILLATSKMTTVKIGHDQYDIYFSK